MMEDELIELLKTFGFPVRRQGSLAVKEKYPDHFFTFWNNDSDDTAHYDNKRAGYYVEFDIFFYSKNPAKTYEVLRSAQALLIENGWICPGDGFDVVSDEPTHTGRGITATIINNC